MYNLNQIQARDYRTQSGVRPVGYYRNINPLGTFWGRMGSLFPYVGPGASIFGLIRSLGVLLAILYVIAPQYVAGLNPNLVFWLSWSSMVLILFPLIRHLFVIVWSASGILMWLVIVAVLYVNVTASVNNRGISNFQWPTSFPNLLNLLSYNGPASLQHKIVAPPSTFQYDREGNQLRYISFENEDSLSNKRVERTRVSPNTGSYVPRWLFSGDTRAATQSSPWSTWFSSWHSGGSSYSESEQLGYDYEALVKKYNQPSRHTSPPSWAIKRPDDNLFFSKPRTNSEAEEGLGGQVLGASQDMAHVVERLAQETLRR